MNNIFYVYKLIDPRNNQPFYIGKGKRYRAWMHTKCYKSDRNLIKINKIKKIISLGLTPIIEIYKKDLSENEALDIETKLIEQYGKIHDNSGILTNFITNDKCISGKNNPNYGHKWTNEQKENLRKQKLGKPGTPHTEKHKLYMRSIQKHKHPIYSIDSKTYEIKKWESVSQFRKFYKLSSNTQPYQSLKNKSNCCMGFYLREINDPNIVNDKIIDLDLFKSESYKKRAFKKVVQKDLKGNIIKIWDSRTEAIQNYPELNIDPSTLTKYIKWKRPYKGYLWENYTY